MSSLLLLPSWKEEPLSPPVCDEATLFDTPFYDDTLEQFDLKFEEDLSICESKAEVASHILENLESLVDLDELIKDEPYLLDVKMLPLLEEVEPPRAILVPVQQIKTEHIKSDNTQYLLKEFETVYDVVELAHGTLTPPQSPPSELTTLEPLLTPSVTYPVVPENSTIVYSVPEKQLLSTGYCNLPVTNGMDIYPTVMSAQPSTDIAHELAVVDELVRSRVEDMQWSSGNSCSSSSPGSPGGSCSSNFGDCSSDDPEWIPDNVENCDQTPTKTSRKRSKPSSKAPPEEKRFRKKEQNKNAATRYRMKKKAEVEVILTEEKILLNKSTELGGQITDLQREIKYLKGLMRDLFKAKGLID